MKIIGGDETMLKVFVPYTENIKNILDMLVHSADGISDVKVIPCEFFGHRPPDLMLGETAKDSYMSLMVERWKLLPQLIEDNMGENICWLDADCVFNKNMNSFCKTINEELDLNDFAFQYDTNSYMSNQVNMGICAVKCSQNTLKFVNDWLSNIIIQTDRVAGFPQLEWNDWLSKKEEYNVSFSILPQTFGYLTEGCVIYHAIGTPDKMGALNHALRLFS